MEEVIKNEIETTVSKTEPAVEETKVLTQPVVEEITKKEEKKKAKPNLFMKPNDRIKIALDVMIDNETGEVASVASKTLDLNIASLSELYYNLEVVFEFSKVNYEQLTMYRKRSSSYNSASRQMIVDRLKVRDHLIYYHLKAWNLKDDNGEIIPIKFDGDMLSSESAELFTNLSPSIVDITLNEYETKMALT